MRRRDRKKSRFRPILAGKRSLQLAMQDNLEAKTTIPIEDGVEIEGLIRVFEEVQQKKWIICPHLRFKKGDGKIKTWCTLTDKHCDYRGEGRPEECVGREKIFPPYKFWVFIDATIGGKEYKFAFVQRDFHDVIQTKTTERSGWLREAYKAINSGRIKTSTQPRPGCMLFHTLMMGKPRVSIYLLDGRKIEGKVDFYEKEPIEIAVSEGDKRYFIPLTNVGLMLIHSYDLGDVQRTRTIELLRRGHVVTFNPKEKGIIYDYCLGRRMKITFDGRVMPRGDNRHDIEVKQIVEEG
jgi:hypothetical protein